MLQYSYFQMTHILVFKRAWIDDAVKLINHMSFFAVFLTSHEIETTILFVCVNGLKLPQQKLNCLRFKCPGNSPTSQ